VTHGGAPHACHRKRSRRSSGLRRGLVARVWASEDGALATPLLEWNRSAGRYATTPPCGASCCAYAASCSPQFAVARFDEAPSRPGWRRLTRREFTATSPEGRLETLPRRGRYTRVGVLSARPAPTAAHRPRRRMGRGAGFIAARPTVSRSARGGAFQQRFGTGVSISTIQP